MAPSYTTSTEATSEQTVLKPKPMSRKVLASAGVAAFVLGNRSRVEILDLRDARMIVCVFSDTRMTFTNAHAHFNETNDKDGGQLSPRISIRETRACPYQNGE